VGCGIVVIDSFLARWGESLRLGFLAGDQPLFLPTAHPTNKNIVTNFVHKFKINLTNWLDYFIISVKGGYDMAEQLGDRVRKARKAYGMSATLLAERAGLTRQLLYMIESNRTLDPGVLKVKALAEVLKVSVDYLLGLKDETSVIEPTMVGAA
jgi:DNA-binding XRE family transcriptional regulator